MAGSAGLALALAALVAAAGGRPRLLAQDEAAVIGAWSAAAGAPDVVALVLRPLIAKGACLALSPSGSVALYDHADLKRGLFWSAHRVAPGRYAVAAVRWGDRGYPTSWGGDSPQEGAPWTVAVASGAVTDIGLWRVSSPYPHRYVVAPVAAAAWLADARALAAPLGPLQVAGPVRAAVARRPADCP